MLRRDYSRVSRQRRGGGTGLGLTPESCPIVSSFRLSEADGLVLQQRARCCTTCHGEVVRAKMVLLAAAEKAKR